MQVKTLAEFKSEILRSKESNLADRFIPTQYLLVLQPHEELNNRIRQIKEDFAIKYDCTIAKHSRPHITLANFVQYDLSESRVISRLRSIASQISPFKVDLDGFGSFPEHTIYINVSTKVKIVEAVREIRQAQRLMKIDQANKPYFITEPHLTIARKLLPWQYEKGWLELSNTHFTGGFMADNMLLLKRGPDREFNKYTEIARFSFEGKKVASAVQTKLF